MSTSRKIGDEHVLNVCSALRLYLSGEPILEFPETVQETVKYIVELYPDIQNITSKFDTDAPDFSPDILITLQNNIKKKINLFYIKGNAAIQPKNPGAKSFLKKYFLSEKLQSAFNIRFTEAYKSYLKSILQTKENKITYDSISQLKKKVKEYYPNFTSEINQLRRNFLYQLRESCFSILKDEYNNIGTEGIKHAFSEFLMINSTNIITRYKKRNKCLRIEELNLSIKVEEISLYKKGNDTIGIRSGQAAFTMRFKFESNPISSIKLATSYENFPTDERILNHNLNTLYNFESIINGHSCNVKSNTSNAIGKCNEALVYYRILKTNQNIVQVDSTEYQLMIEKYSPIISHEDLLDLQEASIITVEKLNDYLRKKYVNYQIDSIQLVPDNYLKNRLDTSDLQLVLKVNNQYIVESFSLKALSKKSAKVNAKNPGIGQILGPQYFNIGTLDNVVFEVREQFQANVINHKESLEKLSFELGKRLEKADQLQLKKGVQALLGESTLIITFYNQNDSVVLEHRDITSEILVYRQTPTPIQTTLVWNKFQEEMSLRVKFSSGQDKGWSSLKLACEWKINIHGK